MPSGLDFPANDLSYDDIRLIWDSTNLLPRDDHTAIWRYYPRQQTGYYAVAWHSPNNGQNTFDGGTYSYGTHSYPASNGAVDSFGNASSPTSTAGTVHFWEEAKDGKDYLTSAGGTTGLQVTKSQWYIQVRRVRDLGNGTWEHSFTPDLLGNPNFVIVQNTTIGTSGAHPAFYFGCSDWQSGLGRGGDSTSNTECPSGIIRGIQLYSKYLPNNIVSTEALNDTSNSPQTVSGTTYVWYMNQDPTSADTNDKSGKGHNPRWDNTNRPALWTSADPGINVNVGVISASYSLPSIQLIGDASVSVGFLSSVLTIAPRQVPAVVEISSISRRLKF